ARSAFFSRQAYRRRMHEPLSRRVAPRTGSPWTAPIPRSGVLQLVRRLRSRNQPLSRSHMRISRWISVLAGIAMLPAGGQFSRVHAQGITTEASGGVGADTSGAPLAAVQIQVRNVETGFVAGSLTRENGRFLVPGLEAGGPYTVTARRIGF